MDEVLTAIEGLFDLIAEFVLDKAFNKKKALKTRLPYIVVYALILILIITCLIIGDIYLIKDSNLISIILLIFAFLFIVMLVYSFIKNSWDSFSVCC